MLSQSRRDGLFEALWCIVGIVSGSIIPAITILVIAFSNGKDGGHPGITSIIDLIQISIFIVSLVVGIVIFIIWKKKGKTAQEIINIIRGHKKS